MTNFLAYGAIGLGLALAVLAYRLLSKEQDRKAAARGPILTATYVFMAFALVLAAGGFVSEYQNSDASQIAGVRAELTKSNSELKSLQAKHDQMREKVNVSQAVMRSLMNLKGGKLASLKQLDPKSLAYNNLVKEIQRDLEQIDEGFKVALEQ
jgi:AICAR transformylase/IMP cyclohydrolase PurH